LALRDAARLGLRTLDTLHVASTLELKADRFWTFDERQKKLARAAGLKTT
jgi:predicted nucleic acid-binding protein